MQKIVQVKSVFTVGENTEIHVASSEESLKMRIHMLISDNRYFIEDLLNKIVNHDGPIEKMIIKIVENERETKC